MNTQQKTTFSHQDLQQTNQDFLIVITQTNLNKNKTTMTILKEAWMQKIET